MDGGSVGVAVDHHPAVVLAQHLVHRRRGHVHDGLALVGIFHLALASHLVGDGLATRERQAQEQPTQPFELGDAAKLLVALIQGAEQIAVAQHHPLAIELDDARIPQQCHAGAFGKGLAQQEVAVAVNEVEGHPLLAQGRKGIGHLAVEGIGIVVANPEFKQIAQHIEGIGAGGVVRQKAHQGGGHVGPLGTQVNVADKEGAHEKVRWALLRWLEVEVERGLIASGCHASGASSPPSRVSSAAYGSPARPSKWHMAASPLSPSSRRRRSTW